MSLRFVIALSLSLAASTAAHATEVCAWLVESNEPENVMSFDLWLQADGEVEGFYQIVGEGVTGENSTTHSRNSGTYVLHAGEAHKIWGFGTTIYPPGNIDIGIELHETPADIFSDEPTPLLAAYSFKREVPESEVAVPTTLAKKQCLPLKAEAGKAGG